MKQKILIALICLFFLAGCFQFSQAASLLDNGLINRLGSFGQKAADIATYNTTDPDSQLNQLITTILLGILSFVGVIFFILVIVSGLQWLNAGGNEDAIKKAKNRIVQSSIGLIVIFGAFIITSVFFFPFYNRFMKTPGGGAIPALGGGPQNSIACAVDQQCADQPTRKHCWQNNCVACVPNNETKKCPNPAEVCTDWGTCAASLAGSCSQLGESTCLQREDCRLQYEIVPASSNGILSIFSTGGHAFVPYCINKADYKCASQCNGDAKHCTNEGRCVECLQDSDCPGFITGSCSLANGICL